MITLGSYRIYYDAVADRWLAVGCGRVETFPSGKAGRRAALRHAIARTDAPLAHAARRLIAREPAVAGRVWDGARLLLAGCVRQPDMLAESHCLSVVHAGPGARRYYINGFQETIACSCADYARGETVVDGHKLCEHALAYRLGRYLKRPLAEDARVKRRKVAAGSWRGRIAGRVNGNGRRSPAPNGDDRPRYANGREPQPDHLPLYDTFLAAVSDLPADEEKLISWYYGR